MGQDVHRRRFASRMDVLPHGRLASRVGHIHIHYIH